MRPEGPAYDGTMQQAGPGRAGGGASAAPSARSILHQVSWLGAGHAVSQVTWYAMVLVLAAILPPRAFGTVAAALAVVGVASLLMQSGTGGSIIATRGLDRGHVAGNVRLNLGVGLVLTVIIAASAQPVASAFAEGGDPAVLQILSLSVILAALSVVPSALLRKTMAFRRLAVVTVTATVVTAVAAIVAAVLGAGVWALVLRQLLLQGLTAVLLWRAVLHILPTVKPRADDAPRSRPQRRVSFLIVSASSFLALSFDNLLVGAATSATELGFYALAFTLAFAPLTQLSWQLGQVLFPAAAATPDLETVGRRTLTVVRITALLLLPLVPPAIALAPSVLPAVLGAEWRPMVTPFQILLVVGVAHAVLNTIGESLSGTGNIRFRAWSDSLWAVGTVIAVFLLARAAGVDGAALGHLLFFVPLAGVYTVLGTKRIGTDARRLWGAVRDVVLAVGAQGAVTLGVVVALGGGDAPLAAAIAAVVGLAVAAAVLHRSPSRPLHEGRALLSRLRPPRIAAG